MTQVPPDAMVARLEQLGRELTAWGVEHSDGSLAVIEGEVLAAVRRMLPGLMEDVLTLSCKAVRLPEAGLGQRCPTCETRRSVHSWRKRQVNTICGPVKYERPYYYCDRCKQGWAPADERLGLEPWQRMSVGLREWLADLGASTVFRDGRRLLEKLTGLAVAAETVRQETERVGAVLEEKHQAAMAMVMKTQEAAEPVERAPGMLVVEADGVMVRYLDGWHEVKVGVVGGHTASAWREKGHTGELSYVAARESREVFGPRLLTEAARRGALEVVSWRGPVTGRGVAELRPVVVLGDGAPWIWNLAADHFGKRTELVDYYHATEHLWAAAHAVYGSGSAEAAAWAEARKGDLYEHGAGPVMAALRRLEPNTTEAREAVRLELGYFRTNQERMNYPEFRKRGFPIGSGAVESAAKHLVQLRMKRSGCRWSENGAHRVLTVRSALISHRPLITNQHRAA